MSNKANRHQLIRLVHVAKRDLALDDETYRAMLEQITSKQSSADLSVPELEKVLEHMKRGGFKVRSKTAGRQQADDAQSKMIRGLWLQLGNMGIVRNSSEAALGTFVQRMTKVEALQWLATEQASQVIEHLKEWRQRVVQARNRAILAALHLPPLRLAAAEVDVIKEAAAQVIGRKVSMDEISEVEFQAILRHFTREAA